MSKVLATVTAAQAAGEKKSSPVQWYRTTLDPAVLKALHERSDALGWWQSAGYLGVLVLTGSTAWYSASHWPVWATVLLVFLHGTCFAFQINAVHELGHGTVFKTRWLNAPFERVFGFLGWINFQMFDVSHVRHHQYTLHPPDDLEVVLPIHVMLKQFFLQGAVNLATTPGTPFAQIKDAVRIADGKFRGDWELKLFPAAEPAKRRPPVRWAWTLLIGHSLIVAISIWQRWWLLPVLTTFAPFIGNWLFFVCNNTQHIGLQDNVADFRLCCRTIQLNPVVRFLYWHMNFHTEHHMYAAVPCYKLGQLQAAIRHDLPPPSRGMIAAWKEIAAIQKKQKTDPSYQYVMPLPKPAR